MRCTTATNYKKNMLAFSGLLGQTECYGVTVKREKDTSTAYKYSLVTVEEVFRY